VIVDFHCHVVPAEMTTAAVPERWRPVLRKGEDGRTEAGLRGSVIRSITGEFTDPGVMLAQAAGQGVDHLVLSPWVSLIPADAEPAEAAAVCAVQNEALAAIAAAHPDRISVLAAVPLQDPDSAAATLRAAMVAPGVAGATQVVLGSDRPFDMGSDHPVDEVRALGQPEQEDLILSGNAARLLRAAVR
jgi:aminocarboxymuconate-semialdehyde decarboxylase